MGRVQQVQNVYPGETNPKLMGIGGLTILASFLFFAMGDAMLGFGALVLLAGVVILAVGAQKRTRPCPNCRTRISPRAQVCPQCQFVLVARSPPPSPPSPMPVTPPPQVPEFRR